ncbi:hypothetical protein ACP4OV_004776 [Aristida adscensionis]
MAATNLSSSPPKVPAKLGGVSRSSSPIYTQLTFCSRHHFQRGAAAAAPSFEKPPPEPLLFSPARRRHARTSRRPATDNDQAAPAAAQQETATTTPPPAAPAPGAEGAPVTPGAGANGSAPSEPPKRAPLTARERLRAARVLGKYAEPAAKGAASKAAAAGKKAEFGSGVLEALREADAKKGGGGGGRRGSRLPEAPGNLFDDSKRGMPKEGWTFELPFGVDVFLVLVSFTLITTIMFGTAFLVWKVGAIHFNEY